MCSMVLRDVKVEWVGMEWNDVVSLDVRRLATAPFYSF